MSNDHLITSPSALRYQVRLLSPATHEVEITLILPDLNCSTVELTLPAWIPGSYMIRDFARFVLEINASDADGQPLTIHKTDKQSWQLQGVNGPCQLRYKVFAFDLSVRSAFYNDEYAFLNGTSVFLHCPAAAAFGYEVEIDTGPFAADAIATSMPYDPTRACYYCADYNELIDHPLFIGNCTQGEFTVSGVRFRLLFSGHQRIDVERIKHDLTAICQHHIALFGGDAPFSSYLFMTLIASAGYGGLEHRNSTALLFPRDDLPWLGEGHNDRSPAYRNFLGLCSHELFHAWHVKRIQPAVMQRPRLDSEVYTPQLWLYEGVTSYYDDLAVVRSGLLSPSDYLQGLAQTLTRVSNTPGRQRQSIAESSFDAWTKFYKQDAHSVNHIVSYYAQGSIVAFALDLWLRHTTANQVTLDDVMRALWQSYGIQGRGTPDDVLEVLCREHFDLDLSDIMQRYVYGRELPPLAQWLETVGLRLHWRHAAGADDKGGAPNSQRIRFALGASYKAAEVGVVITQVLANSAAAQAGLFVDDRVVAINAEVVSEKRLQRHLDSLDEAPLLTLIRDGRLLQCHLPLVAASPQVAYFVVEDQARLNTWLQSHSLG